jgi:hypothetical protein
MPQLRMAISGRQNVRAEKQELREFERALLPQQNKTSLADLLRL